MNAPATILPFKPAPSLFDSMRRSVPQLTAEEKLNLIDALVEHGDLNWLHEADEIARQVGNMRAEIMPVETLDPYGVEQFSRAAVAGWPL